MTKALFMPPLRPVWIDEDMDGRSPISTPAAMSGFHRLPAELRLNVWSYASEPRIVILDDLVQNPRSYPIPAVTQLNSESRFETREGYEPVGRGSHINFSRDILVCDPNISDQSSNKSLEELAPRVQRLAFWDCFPDDGRIDGPNHYSAYLARCYPQLDFGRVEFDKFWFPNLKDLWIVKIGEVDRSWMVGVDQNLPYDVRLRKTARQFRYWIDENIVEIAPLDLDEPETKAVLRQGRCGKVDCQTLNRGQSKMVSKVIFMDGKFRKMEGSAWQRIMPWSTKPAKVTEKDTCENRMRWIIVERILTFSLRWEGSEEEEEEATLTRRKTPEALGRRMLPSTG